MYVCVFMRCFFFFLLQKSVFRCSHFENSPPPLLLLLHLLVTGCNTNNTLRSQINHLTAFPTFFLSFLLFDFSSFPPPLPPCCAAAVCCYSWCSFEQTYKERKG